MQEQGKSLRQTAWSGAAPSFLGYVRTILMTENPADRHATRRRRSARRLPHCVYCSDHLLSKTHPTGLPLRPCGIFWRVRPDSRGKRSVLIITPKIAKHERDSLTTRPHLDASRRYRPSAPAVSATAERFFGKNLSYLSVLLAVRRLLRARSLPAARSVHVSQLSHPYKRIPCLSPILSAAPLLSPVLPPLACCLSPFSPSF